MTMADRLAGRHILLVEDEYFIADDLRQFLHQEGAKVIGRVGTVQDALDTMREAPRIDGAVVDINLGGEWAYPVADELQRRGISFVFVTGYDEGLLPHCHVDAKRCEKPVSPDIIAAALLS